MRQDTIKQLRIKRFAQGPNDIGCIGGAEICSILIRSPMPSTVRRSRENASAAGQEI